MSKRQSTENFKLSDPIHFLALGFGSGLSPKAPGTFGTLAAIPVFLLMSGLSLEVYGAVVAIMSLFGIYICGKAATDAGVHDHGAIVWDEIVGYLITMLMLPVTWQTVVVGFILFRIFDIFKPWPISFIDKHCHGGFGIMLDDIIAGFMALGCMHLIF
ncbi:phosphatidylglycerophosphatase A family protein [Thalassotalea sp. PLHSN55]|uniref:phosphatidylglycerophosphatase A family protein n=1 Tax=Thalassotalea sp. PLHSN55 TaxID=3435888 RepID=UPI003F829850